MAKTMEYLKDRRIITLVVVVLALGVLDLHYGLHFGIEFVGGTQIPVQLQHSVNITTMTTLISALDQRLSTFGLQQVTIEGIGDSELYIIIPNGTSSEINHTISLIQTQGRFDGIVNGKAAINGSGIIKSSIGAVPPQTYNNTVTWQVDFFITQAAEAPFEKAVFGQTNQPLYMYLDRPTDAVILINSSVLASQLRASRPGAAIAAMEAALKYGNQTIPVMAVSATGASVNTTESFFADNSGKYRNVFASYNLNQTLISWLMAHNYTVRLESGANMTPTFTSIAFNESVVNTWPMVGLLSAPVLAPSITNGNVSNSYQISGAAPINMSVRQQLGFATNQTKSIASILSGGALPVAVIPGTPTTTPPTLGSHFLLISGMTALIAVVFVSLFMVFRYKKMFLVAPIVITTLMELYIIVSIIGLIGTIDLSAVAGMIAVIGTGVDAQVIITDEIIAKKVNLSAQALLGKAFYIIWADAALLVIAMIPLFLSTSLVDVIGFSEATIFGALLSVFITRPAYGAIISKRYGG